MGLIAVCALPNSSNLKPNWIVAPYSGPSVSRGHWFDSEVGLYTVDHPCGELNALDGQVLSKLRDVFSMPVGRGFFCGGPGLTLASLKSHIRAIQILNMPGYGECAWPWFDSRYLKAILQGSQSKVELKAWGPIHWIVYFDPETGLSVLNASQIVGDGAT